MTTYQKGARSERELIKIFSEAGFSVIRAAGSGVSQTSPPDILVLKGDLRYAIECKAWNKNRIAIPPEKYIALLEWEKNTNIKTLIGWKLPYKGWKFVSLNELEKNANSYSITMKKIEEVGKEIKSLLA